MKLQQADIVSFGKFNQCKFDFSDGMNIVMGENESGKSTLLAFIRYMLWGFSSKADRVRYLNFHTGYAAGNLMLDCDGIEYRIERKTLPVGDGTDDKQSYRETVKLIDLSTGSVLPKIKSPGEYFFDVDESLFTQSCFVAQLDTLEVGCGDIMQAIENILFSASEEISVKKARKRLDAARVLLLHKNAKGGMIADLSDQRDRIYNALEQAKNQNIERQQIESALCGMKQKRDFNREQKILRKEKLDACALFADWQDYQTGVSLKKKYDDVIRSQNVLRDEFAQKGFTAETVDETYLQNLQKAKLEYQFAERSLQDTQAEYALCKNQYEAQKSRYTQVYSDMDPDVYKKSLEELSTVKKRRKACVFGTCILAILLLCCLGGIFIFRPLLFPVSVILSGFAALFGIGAFVSFFGVLRCHRRQNRIFEIFSSVPSDGLESHVNQAFQHKAEIDRLEDTLNRLSKRQEEKQRDANEKAEIVQHILQNAGIQIDITSNDPDQVETEIRSFLKAQQILRAEAEKYLLAYQNIILPESFSPEHASECLAAFSQKYPEVDLKATDTVVLKREYDFYTQAGDMLEEKIAEAEKKIAALSAIAANPAQLQEEQTALEDRIQKLSQRHAAIVAADEALAEASQKLQNSVSPRLSEMSGSYMSALTDGKYTKIGFNSDYSLNYFDGTETHDLVFLSQGSKDAAYISLRLALVRLIYQKTLPPLFLDESFARLDNVRLKAVLRLLAENQKDFQTFIFTCHERESIEAEQFSKVHVLHLNNESSELCGTK